MTTCEIAACGSGCLALLLGMALAAAAPGTGGDEQERVIALWDQGRRLAGASCTRHDVDQAWQLYREGERILRRTHEVPPDVGCRFLMDAAECSLRRGIYGAAAEWLRSASQLTEAKDAAAAEQRLKEVEPVADRWKQAEKLSVARKGAEAIAALERIAEDFPLAAAAALYKQVQVHVGLGQLAQATRKARELATRYKGTFQGEAALAGLGGLYFRQGTPEKALAAFHEYFETYGDARDRGMVYWNMARCYAGMGNKEKALEKLALARRALASITLTEDARDSAEKGMAATEAEAKAIKPK